ncbi:fungal specific transcription factor domain-containing protein [Sarocladium implicatum]|nr:fungal specific transcription factor domain-containing protein [Sarocladium implicatum]
MASQDRPLLAAADGSWPQETEFDWNMEIDPFARVDLEEQMASPDPAFSFLVDTGDSVTDIPADALEQSHDFGETGSLKARLGGDSVARSAMDLKPGHSTTFIGYSNESDPFALDHFPYDKEDELDFFRVTYKRFTQYESGQELTRNPPVHFLQSQTETAVEARKTINECLPKLDGRAELEAIVDNAAGAALVKLFIKFVYPALPIISRTLVLQNIERFVAGAPTGLLAGIYALSLPFAPWDDTLCLSNAYSKPSMDALWKVTYTCLQRELHFPHLSCVQIYLLLLNHFQFDSVSVETPFIWSTAAAMLAMAQSLGLNIDPNGWNLPDWEIRLRRRLWWAVLVETTWRSVTHGRASMIRHDDWDVSSLTSSDFALEDDLKSVCDMSDQSPQYFIRLCSLTLIADGICRRFFTLRAVSQPASLNALIAQARDFRQELLDWYENLPECLQLHTAKDSVSPEDPVESHAPLYIAYYTTHILLFRALLRPILQRNSDLSELQGSVSAILSASRSLIQTMMKFICSLDARHQSAFWPAYTRHCFSYPGLFCFMLSKQVVEQDMQDHDRSLLERWRKMLRTRVQSWPLLRFSIVKIDAIYWRGVQKSTS